MNTFFAFFTALTTAVVLVPLVRSLAIRVGLVDNPDAERKLHSRPIALAGGVAVFASMLASIILTVGFQNQWSFNLEMELFSKRWLVLLGAAVAILVVGLVDDKWSLRGRQKLLAQCVIAMVIVGSGTALEVVGFFGVVIPLGVFALPVSVLWLLLCTNALNLLDGADGMATTVGIFVSGSLAVVSLINGNAILSVVAAFSLCGALVGFLFYNRPPASIFLGDAGSMMVGLFVGVLAMWCSHKETTAFAAAPLAILVLPLFDSLAAIVRRRLTGRSIYATDRGHMHHLLNEKFGRAGTLCVVAAACSVSSAGAIASTWLRMPWLAPLGAILVLAVFVSTRTFGYSECRLLAGRVRHWIMSFLVRPHVCDAKKHERSLKMQGDGPWQDVWEPLIDFAEKQELASVKIDVNMAWLHESYHATWRSIRLPEPALQSVVRIPLLVSRENGEEVEQVPIGRIEIIATSTSDSLSRLGDFLEHAAELQLQVEDVVDRIEAIKQTPARTGKTKPTQPTSAPIPEDVLANLS
ncbi:MraY family glycosyltransferase [Aporhodopirellula aestuarii]|uniref:Undecaprenyl/decaprenyl-phosphate alpha-N-acetylglucosaminyl 1-phosphate transferase n=1 Tax=Aporhodopirellula aestuarii TaxID=2950107 RepID=A0ABT0U923_9BACT|nr:MraY family glycosyltransferase [Aporhodopirellula aestuarii]MCM2373194.1 undecaprenyl/decaprenyl-phosphate alpha-N-acetylglucosaminyl 1-phosphate transferase [Aporhodopirellula aestuarii]